MILRIVLAGFLAILPGLARATVYDCKVNPGSMNLGWLTEQYFFDFVEDPQRIEIFDAIVSKFNKDTPVEGKVRSKNDAKVAFSWALFVMDSTGKRTKMDFRGVLYFANMEFSVQGQPVGYSNKFDARGVCAIAG